MLQERPRPACPDPGRRRGRRASINPRFLSPINLANTANLIGLFGLFSHRPRPSSSSPAASSCRSARSSRCSASSSSTSSPMSACTGAWPLLHRHRLGVADGRSCTGCSITRMRHAALRRDALRPADLSRHRPLLHRGRHRRLRLRPELPDARMADHRAAPSACRTASIAFVAIAARAWRVVLHRSVFGRYLFAVGKNEEAARYSGIRTAPGHHRRLRDLLRR